jgi:hypothetical protein
MLLYLLVGIVAGAPCSRIKPCSNGQTGATVFMGKPASRHLNFLLLAMCAVLAISGEVQAAFAADGAEDSAFDGQKRPPRPVEPVEPPHKPAQQGTRLAVIVGINFFTYGRYAYKTAITMPDGSMLNYSGNQSALGGTLLFGAAVTPPAVLRRLTLGITVNGGGLDAWSHPVIPNGVETPFSQGNLNAQIRRNAALSYGWHPAISPYIEHELGFLLASRVRAGYQYWRQSGAYQGSFPIDQTRSVWADYNIRLLHSAHLIRLSINNHTSLEDDTDTNPSAKKRGPGFLRQAGLLVGTNRTVMVFVGFGPSWNF